MYNSNLAIPVSNYQQSRMITTDDIVQAYKVARRNKRRSPDQVEFELHWEANCMKLYDAIVNRCVRPTAYTFITDIPKPREVFASDMGTRVLHHYLDIRLRPLLERRLSTHTFNNRVGMGQAACQNALIRDIYEVSEGFTRDAWIVKIDMSGCFPNIVQEIAYKQLEEVVLNDYHGADRDELLYILRVCVFSYPVRHCYRKSPYSKWQLIPPHKSLFSKPDGIGAAIGHLIWQNAVNYYFHEIDEWLISLDIRFERFVDDFAFVVNNKTFLLLLPELRKRLEVLGAHVNEDKFYCQHYTKGVEWLGAHIKLDRIYPNERIVKRGLQCVHKLNKNARESNVEYAISALNSYLGIFKNANGYNKARKIVRTLSQKWNEYIHFNRERVCMQANPPYTYRNLIINKYKLAA